MTETKTDRDERASYHLYAVSVGCPTCHEVTQFVEIRDDPVPVNMDISVDADHCPHCGIHLAAIGAEWDLQAEHEVTTRE